MASSSEHPSNNILCNMVPPRGTLPNPVYDEDDAEGDTKHQPLIVLASLPDFHFRGHKLHPWIPPEMNSSPDMVLPILHLLRKTAFPRDTPSIQQPLKKPRHHSTQSHHLSLLYVHFPTTTTTLAGESLKWELIFKLFVVRNERLQWVKGVGEELFAVSLSWIEGERWRQRNLPHLHTDAGGGRQWVPLLCCFEIIPCHVPSMNANYSPRSKELDQF